MLLLDVVVCDLATLICVKVQRWDHERAPDGELRDRNNPSNSQCCRMSRRSMFAFRAKVGIKISDHFFRF